MWGKEKGKNWQLSSEEYIYSRSKLSILKAKKCCLSFNSFRKQKGMRDESLDKVRGSGVAMKQFGSISW